MTDSKNLILAIVLSIVVLIGWQYFIAGPQIERTRQQQISEQQPAATEPGATTPGATATTAPPVPGAPTTTAVAPTVTLTRAEALAQSPRVAIATQRVSGSVNLRGGRIDDVHLNDFHETVDPASPTIILLSPTGGPDGYFAEFGWIGEPNGGAVPGPDTLWTAPAEAKLTESTPLTLTFDNGAGLTFTRKIAVDEYYMFTVTDTVANATGTAVTLTPYGRVTRLGQPKTTGYFILHEGLIGVFGDEGLEEVDYSDLDDPSAKDMPKVEIGRAHV